MISLNWEDKWVALENGVHPCVPQYRKGVVSFIMQLCGLIVQIKAADALSINAPP